MIFYAKKINNTLEFEAPVKFKSYIDSLPNCRVMIKVQKYRPPRTLPQNGYYWKILEIAGVELGYEPEELHSSFKAMFLTDKTKEIPVVRSTAKLTTVEFRQYLDKVIKKIAELGIVIMSPDEFYNLYEDDNV